MCRVTFISYTSVTFLVSTNKVGYCYNNNLFFFFPFAHLFPRVAQFLYVGGVRLASAPLNNRLILSI